MTNGFYIIRTQVDNIYKFGQTTRNVDTRIEEYKGLHTAKKVIVNRKVKDNSDEEFYFKMFLKYRKIEIVYGFEFFKFDGGIDILVMDFDRFDRVNCITKLQYQTDLSKSTMINNYAINKNTNKYRCNKCNKSFGGLTGLNVHNKNTHNEGKQKVRKGNKTKDYAKHKNTDKYKCFICNKRFGNISALQSHRNSKKHKIKALEQKGF